MNLQEFLNEVNGRESDIVCYAGEEALAAVKCNGDALQYVKDQSEAVCLAAVKQDSDALQYVDKRIFKNTEVFTETPEVCIKCFTIEDCPLIAALRSEIESLRCSGIEIEPCALFLAINKAPN